MPDYSKSKNQWRYVVAPRLQKVKKREYTFFDVDLFKLTTLDLSRIIKNYNFSSFEHITNFPKSPVLGVYAWYIGDTQQPTTLQLPVIDLSNNDRNITNTTGNVNVTEGVFNFHRSFNFSFSTMYGSSSQLSTPFSVAIVMKKNSGNISNAPSTKILKLSNNISFYHNGSSFSAGYEYTRNYYSLNLGTPVFSFISTYSASYGVSNANTDRKIFLLDFASGSGLKIYDGDLGFPVAGTIGVLTSSLTIDRIECGPEYGHMAEVIVYDHRLNETEKESLKNYLNERNYGVTCTYNAPPKENLQLWYKPDDINSVTTYPVSLDRVASLTDQSEVFLNKIGNPTVDVNVFNQKRHYNCSNLYYFQRTGSFDFPIPYTVYVTCRKSINNSVNIFTLNTGSGNVVKVFYNTGITMSNGSSTFLANVPADTNRHSFLFEFNGSGSAVYDNNFLTPVSSGYAGTGSINMLNMGVNENGTTNVPIYIAEFMLWNKILTTEEKNQLASYVNFRDYGVTVANS